MAQPEQVLCRSANVLVPAATRPLPDPALGESSDFQCSNRPEESLALRPPHQELVGFFSTSDVV